MTVPALEVLAQKERAEFLRLYRVAPHEMNATEIERWNYFASVVDVPRYQFEVLREEARKPIRTCCQTTKDGFSKVDTLYGVLELPDVLIPDEMRQPPSDKFYSDVFFATLTADLDTRKITSFKFEEYLRRHTQEEIDRTFEQL